MKASEATELSNNDYDIDQFRVQFLLNEIYTQIRKTAILKGSYTEYFYLWNIYSSTDSRKALLRSALEKLVELGYRVTGEVHGSTSVTIKISWAEV